MNHPLQGALEPALFYVPEAYRTQAPKLMGRNAAGEAFLRAWLRHSRQAKFRGRVIRAEHHEEFAADVHRLRPDAQVETVTPQTLARLGEGGLLYYPGPDIAGSANERSLFGATRWSLCGVTHTTASAAAMDAISSWLTAPIYPWDAVICTSQAVLQTVKAVLEAQAAQLAARMGASRMTLPMLPVIPLGVHADDFQASAQDKADARAALGIAPEAVAVLYVGRLSFHAKAHPLAMYQALQAARAGLPDAPPVVLIECGWHANEGIENAYNEAAAAAMPDVHRLRVEGRDAAARRHAWAAADIFCSLSDNIQETFGLTPVEAMAAGLPTVVSDWNGYRDTVRDGIDGFRVPTWTAPPGDGADWARGHALGTLNYDHYCGNASAAVAIDPRATRDALAALIASPERRAEMGAAARQRALTVFDWEVVYRQYELLWAEQAQRRAAAAEKLRDPPHPWPARMDPSTAFAGYPTQALGAQTRLSTAAATADLQTQMERLAALAMVRPFSGGPAGLALARNILEACSSGADLSLAELGARLAHPVDARLRRRVLWLAKLGLLHLSMASEAST